MRAGLTRASSRAVPLSRNRSVFSNTSLLTNDYNLWTLLRYTIRMALFGSRSHSSRKGTYTVALFDIGSGSVGVALAEVESGCAEIRYHKRLPIAIAERPTFEQLSKSMFGTLADLALLLQNKGIARLGGAGEKERGIDTILCVFAAPWYTSKTDLVTVRNKSPFAVTRSIIENILADTARDFAGEERKDERFRRGIRLIEQSVIETALNGYVVSNPYQKKVQQLDTTIFMSAIPSNVYAKVRSVLGQVFNARRTVCHSFPLVAFSVVRNLFPSSNDFLLVDVTGEVTDITVVRDNVIHEHALVPMGKNALLREIARLLKTVPEEAQSLVKLHLEGASSLSRKDQGETYTAIEQALLKAENEWKKAFEKALQALSREKALPFEVYLSADSSVDEWFARMVEGSGAVHRDGRQAYSPGHERAHTVHVLDPETLGKHCVFSNHGPFDVFLAISGLFAAAVHEEDARSLQGMV